MFTVCFFVWSQFSPSGLHRLAWNLARGFAIIPDRSFEILGAMLPGMAKLWPFFFFMVPYRGMCVVYRVFFVWSRFSLLGLHRSAWNLTRDVTSIPGRSFETLGVIPSGMATLWPWTWHQFDLSGVPYGWICILLMHLFLSTFGPPISPDEDLRLEVFTSINKTILVVLR